ncbi:hypothetical protein M9Y10_011453 [Tritrichomonas musculus]|uniref:UBR-type domain-containing protein n=1 Tax=Tritrichomonas musculus TaxID=1915356 RepID=A0ABR2IJF7_9EUKA
MEVSPELNPLLPLQCTKEFTGEIPTKQRFCYCLDCDCTPENKKTICEPCAFACHCNHRIVYAGQGECICHCPNCKAKKPVDKIPFDDTSIPTLNPNQLEKGKCTFKFTKGNFVIQRSYRCKTCNQQYGEGVCSVCARICHSGHELIETGINPFYCDCGSNGIKKEGFKCLCMSDNNDISNEHIIDLPFEIPAKCTFSFTNGKVYHQRGFSCKTCGITEENPICEVCAVKCHSGHDLVDLKLKPFSKCGCQKCATASGCKCLSDTDEIFVPSICAEPQPIHERCDCCCEYEEEEEDECNEDNDGENHHCHHHHCHDHQCDCGSCGCHHHDH